MTIKYINADALVPQDKNKPTFILHACNNWGKWGAGFVLAISNKWSSPEKIYRSRKSWKMGNIDVVHVDHNIYVINMICQNGIRKRGDHPNKTYINYDQLRICLDKAKIEMNKISTNYNINMPKIGCGLAGGNWSLIEPIIQDVFNDGLINIYVCTL